MENEILSVTPQAEIMETALSPLKKINFKVHLKLKSSRLYSLQPIGVGTSMIESFTSYITRLAGAHCTTLGVLIAVEISPLLKKKYLDSQRSRKIQGGPMLGIAKSMDSTGQIANEWTQTLEKLTLRKDIHLLTMLPFSGFLSTRDLLRNRRAWCPLCYESMRNKQEIIYELLLWRLKAVIFCPIHNTLLQESCNSCGKDRLPILTSSTSSGFCHYCKQWLGYSKTEKVISEEDGQFQLSISKSVAEVLAISPYLYSSITRQSIKTNLNACIKHYTKGNISKFARLTNVSVRIISNWRNGTNLFRLDVLAQICQSLNLPLKQFWDSNIIWSNTLKSKDLNQTSKGTQHKRAINLTEMKELLENAVNKKSPVPSLGQLVKDSGYDFGCFKRHFPELCEQLKEHYSKYKKTEQNEFLVKMKAALNEYPPPSVADLSRRFNRCVPTLYKSFATICYEITKKHKAYKENLRNAQRLAIIKEVKKIAIRLYKEGVYPSQKNVSQLMSKPGRINNEPAKTVLREIQQQLENQN